MGLPSRAVPVASWWCYTPLVALGFSHIPVPPFLMQEICRSSSQEVCGMDDTCSPPSPTSPRSQKALCHAMPPLPSYQCLSIHAISREGGKGL
mmetsp:Transcript_51755/g.92318  ORF Transcript_51755/g.92318 Transcript_51755/m.92318 type:complete len:93 (-) Transcript_51755:453-731(-)